MLWKLGLARELFAVPIDPDTSDYWNRLGYGVTAVKTKQVCITKGYWNLELHLKLPYVPATFTRNTSRATARNCDCICDRMGCLLNVSNTLLKTVQMSIKKMVHRIDILLTDDSHLLVPKLLGKSK